MIIRILLLILLSNQLYSETSVKATLDAYEYQIGDHIKLELEANLPKDWNVVFPVLSDSIKSFEIIRKTKLDTIIGENSNQMKLRQLVTLTQFDSGSYEIPQLTFVFDPKKDELGEFQPKKTNAISLLVSTIEIDTSQTFKDIKSNIEPEFTIWEYKQEIYIGLAIIAGIILAVILFKKFYKKKETEDNVEIYDPKIEPHVLALNKLNSLKNKKLWQEGKYKDYYTEIIDILRLYIKRLFKIDASEMTSDEIIDSLLKIKKVDSEIEQMTVLLGLSDLVKFAKQKPLPNENENALEIAISFVNNTIEYSTESMSPPKSTQEEE